MKTILHMSDIHFGRTDPGVVTALIRAAVSLSPDLVVISGDLTQRARIVEFKAAQEFIQALRAAGLSVFAIPGNHDIEPVYSPLRRIRKPYARFEAFIAALAQKEHVDDEIAVCSVNTVRVSRLKSGRISSEGIRRARAWLAALPPKLIRIVVTHHPLDLPSPHKMRKLAGRSELGIYELALERVDLYLSGHYHRSSTVSTRMRYTKPHYGAVAVQAGTVSDRKRGELQSFNFLRVERSIIRIQSYRWAPEKNDFALTETSAFACTDGSWAAEPSSETNTGE